MTTFSNSKPPITLEYIEEQKLALSKAISKKGEEIGAVWHTLVTPKRATTKGELVTSIISNGITAFDTFMLVRKLMNRYGHLFSRRSKKKS